MIESMHLMNKQLYIQNVRTYVRSKDNINSAPLFKKKKKKKKKIASEKLR